MNAPKTDAHEFADRIFEKCNRRQRKLGSRYDYNWPEAVRDMVRDRLVKEGWRRIPTSDFVGKPTP